MQAKTFIGKLNVTIGEYENNVTILVVANSSESAYDVLFEAAKSYYGADDEDNEDENSSGSYSSNNGEICTTGKGVTEIGLSTFLDIRKQFVVYRAKNVKEPTEDDLDGTLKSAAQAVTKALNREQKVVSHSQVLNALSSAVGNKNWQVHLAKVAPEPMANVEDTEGVELAARIKQAQTPAPIGFDEAAGAIWEAMPDVLERARWAPQIRLLGRKGYTVKNTGYQHGWYLLMPGETEFSSEGENHNYLGFFSSLKDLVLEARDTLNIELSETEASLMSQRHFVADEVFVDAELGAVESVGGWTMKGSLMYRNVFIDEGQPDTVVRVFEISFTEGSAHPEYFHLVG